MVGEGRRREGEPVKSVVLWLGGVKTRAWYL